MKYYRGKICIAVIISTRSKGSLREIWRSAGWARFRLEFRPELGGEGMGGGVLESKDTWEAHAG